MKRLHPILKSTKLLAIFFFGIIQRIRPYTAKAINKATEEEKQKLAVLSWKAQFKAQLGQQIAKDAIISAMRNTNQ